MSAMKRAAIYLRVSTAAQATRGREPEGYSIPAQREACQAKATELDAEVVGEYVDRGESAKTADRPALKELLARLEAQRDLDYVIVHKVDRLARNRYDDATITYALHEAGVELVSVTENIDRTPVGTLHARHRRRQCRVLLGQPGGRGEEGPGAEGEDGRHPDQGTARLPQRPQADRRPRTENGRGRSRTRAARPLGLRRLRLGGLHHRHSAGRIDRARAAHPPDAAKARKAALAGAARLAAPEPLLRGDCALRRGRVRGPPRAPDRRADLRQSKGRAGRAHQLLREGPKAPPLPEGVALLRALRLAHEPHLREGQRRALPLLLLPGAHSGHRLQAALRPGRSDRDRGRGRLRRGPPGPQADRADPREAERGDGRDAHRGRSRGDPPAQTPRQAHRPNARSCSTPTTRARSRSICCAPSRTG